MRILVTGATGFVGGHLVEALLTTGGHEVVGLGRRGAWPPEWTHLDGRIELQACDLADRSQVEGVLRTFQPERVFHLAGYAHAGQSMQDVEAAWAGNLTATLGLFEAVRRTQLQPRILSVGTGLIYGDATDPSRQQDETFPLCPASPYAASKAAADLTGYQVHRSFGIDVVRVRPFNHIGPRQSAQYAASSFARQIVAIERGDAPPVLKTGNLSARRDLTDVRDMVQAYLALMEHGRGGEAYNAGTGQAVSMQSVLDRLLALASVSIRVEANEALMRARETAALCCDATKLRRETGWAPRIPLERTLADLLDYWREQK